MDLFSICLIDYVINQNVTVVHTLSPVTGCTGVVYTKHNLWWSRACCRAASPYVTRNQRQGIV